MKRVLALCCASVAAWWVASPALAQSGPVAGAGPQGQQVGVNPSGASTMSPSDGTSSLSEIIVTAQRRSERAESVPLAITAVSGDELQKASINSIEGLSQSIPNVEFGSNAADAKIFIRGVGYDSIAPGGETRVAVYDNNVYESRSQAAFTTLYDIDRVEVLRGPQGTLYGRK